MKFWLLALMIPSISLAFQSTQQESCSPVDLRNETLGQVRDQGTVSWCYAFTAADMLNYSYNESEKISAADVAIGYNETAIGLFMRWLDVNLISKKDPNIKKEAHQTGFNKKALLQTMKVGWCPESIFPSEKWIKVTRTDKGFKEEEVLLGQAMLDINQLHTIRKSLTPETIPFFYKFKNVDAATFTQLIQTNFLNSFYFALRKTVCQNDRRPFDHKSDVKMIFKNPKIFNHVAGQLQNHQVVAIDYDARILEDSSNHSVKISKLHTSIIVARRWNSERQSCEYLIRNSHGEQCDGKYDPTYECESGNLWLSESQIYKNMTSLVFMPAQ